ncbi:hypothetical protein CIHG_02113 [Coccidioides immitis H538.4]|uniref:Uncharacterized protein n=1 Tax=Coccidioides immitis H538.4 TaxID=396776 RepID=A0A0J8RHI0_COCIT|nr:hypothetical protein CIHG_02113 [Coccidioides immitis H538.4]
MQTDTSVIIFPGSGSFSRATTRDKKLDGASNPQSKQTTRALYSTALTAKVTDVIKHPERPAWIGIMDSGSSNKIRLILAAASTPTGPF